VLLQCVNEHLQRDYDYEEQRALAVMTEANSEWDEDDSNSSDEISDNEESNYYHSCYVLNEASEDK
jgi:uncharacterized protein YdaT